VDGHHGEVIAEEAAVAPATVYAVFGTKRAVLSALIDEAVASVLPDPGLPGAWPEVVGHPDQRERARRLVTLMSATLPRVEPFERVVREGARADDEIAGLARDLLDWRRGATTWNVEVLAGEDGLLTSSTCSAGSSPTRHRPRGAAPAAPPRSLHDRLRPRPDVAPCWEGPVRP
jgi:AcrR family transcriptional regulator